MNAINLVREAIMDTEEDQVRTSAIIQKCIRISLLTNDLYHLALFKLIMTGQDDIHEINNIKISLKRSLIKKGISENEIVDTYSIILEEYIQLKRIHLISEDQKGVLSYSLPEIETRLHGFQTSLERNVVPGGLHPLDSYVENNTKKK